MCVKIVIRHIRKLEVYICSRFHPLALNHFKITQERADTYIVLTLILNESKVIIFSLKLATNMSMSYIGRFCIRLIIMILNNFFLGNVTVN